MSAGRDHGSPGRRPPTYSKPPAPQISTGLIYCGDCLSILKDARRFPDGSVDLIYLDPPFFSKKDYENIWIKDKATKLKFRDKNWDMVRATVDPNLLAEYKAIEDRWRGGKNGIHVFIAYMRERIDQCYRVLSDTGSLYLHCDWHASHYLKTMLDEVFGYNNFKNEIIWNFNTIGGNAKKYEKSHESIFWYTKTDKYYFDKDKVRQPYSEKFLKSLKADSAGKLVYSRGLGKDGKKLNRKRQSAINPLGKSPPDVWTDIPQYNPPKKEAQNYPTQKPMAVLKKIIGSSSREGDVVLDPFCGCGTTLSSAIELKRRWVGIDISRSACDVMAGRLGGSANVVGCESLQELEAMDPHEFARLVIVEKMNGTVNPRKSGDLGIDGWIELMTVPVQVKRWKNKVGRPEVDKFKTAVERDRKTDGMIVASGFSRDAVNEVERIKVHDGISIKLVAVGDIFGLNGP